MKRFYIAALFSVLCSSTMSSQNVLTQDSLYLKARGLRFSNPDSSAFYLKKGYELNLKEKDTTNAINFLLELSQLYSHNVNYGKSYDGYWEALLLADQSKDSISISRVYHGLGWLFGFYKREKEALEKFNLSNKIRKELINNENRDVMLDYIRSNYFAIINLYRDLKDYDKAKIYLDSAYQIQKQLPNRPKSYYLEAESGYLASVDGHFDLALQKLNNAKEYFEVNDPSYLVLVEMFYGDVYQRMNKNDESIFHYKKSLEISNKYHRHLNTDLIVYHALSDMYLKQNKLEEAIKYLKKGNNLSEKIFGRSSANSRHLLEIKDLYRIEKKKQEDLRKQERINQLESEYEIRVWKYIVLIVTILFLILFGYFNMKNIRNRHKVEKQNLKETQKLKTQRHKEILELKNKELTESALRLIEKDEFIATIRNRLENQTDKIDVKDINRILNLLQRKPNSNWEEFEARFTSINTSFYSNLKNEFPNLSQVDLRICALVKLNFPSKEMSRLLGISIESVHTSRYRLRKKLNLDRDTNLEEFIDRY